MQPTFFIITFNPKVTTMPTKKKKSQKPKISGILSIKKAIIKAK